MEIVKYVCNNDPSMYYVYIQYSKCDYNPISEQDKYVTIELVLSSLSVTVSSSIIVCLITRHYYNVITDKMSVINSFTSTTNLVNTITNWYYINLY